MKIFIEIQMYSIPNGLDIPFLSSYSIGMPKYFLSSCGDVCVLFDAFDVCDFDCHLSFVSVKLVSFFYGLRNDVWACGICK